MHTNTTITTLHNRLVSSYLVHHGYTATAESFARATNTPLNEDIASIRNRQSECDSNAICLQLQFDIIVVVVSHFESTEIIKMVMSGRMGKAIEHTMKSYPTVLESNLNLLFTLKCRQFVEMVNGSDFKVSARVACVACVAFCVVSALSFHVCNLRSTSL